MESCSDDGGEGGGSCEYCGDPGWWFGEDVCIADEEHDEEEGYDGNREHGVFDVDEGFLHGALQYRFGFR